MVTMNLNTAGCVFKKIIENLENLVLRAESSQGSIKLSLIVVLMVGAQLFVTVSISQAVIFLLLMTSGDVERNPGPEQTLISRCNSSFILWLSVQSFRIYYYSFQNSWSQNNCFYADNDSPASCSSYTDLNAY